MKKITLFCGALLASVMTLNATVLYEGEAKTIANWDVNLQVSNEELPNLEEGCLIAVTVSATAKDEENNHIPAISIQNGAWRDMNCGEYDIETGVHAFVLTKDQVDTIANTGGIIIRGSYYSYTKVELLYPDTLWTGTLSDNKGWEQSAELSKDLFTTIEEGFVYNVTLKQTEGGTIAYTKKEECNEIELTATPDEGYEFVKWNDDNTDATRTVAVNSDIEFSATFQVKPTAISQTNQKSKIKNQKVIKDGQLLILHDGKSFNAVGQEVK